MNVNGNFQNVALVKVKHYELMLRAGDKDNNNDAEDVKDHEENIIEENTEDEIILNSGIGVKYFDEE